MDRNRLMMLGAALAAVIVIAGGFFLGVSPRLNAASAAQTSKASVDGQNDTLTTSLATLKSQYSKLDSLKAKLNSLKSSVPDTAATAAFISEVNGLAKSTGVQLTSISIGDAVAYVPPVDTSSSATDTSTSTSTASSSASPSATASATPTETTPTAPTLATSPLITASNFSDLPVTISVNGTHSQGLAFLNGLRKGTRLFTATTISYAAASGSSAGTSGAADSSSSNLSWSVGGLIYALTDSTSALQEQQSTTSSTASGTASDSSTTDSAAGK